MTLGSLTEIERAVRTACGSLDPASVPLPEVAGTFSLLDSISRLAEGAKLRLLARLDESGAARAAGFRSTAELAARRSGATVGEVQDALDASKRLGGQPHLETALARGELSVGQVRAISDAAAADPQAERGLVATGRTTSLRDLRRACAEVKANAHPDPGARRRALHAARSCRTWTDREGAWHLSAQHLPDVAAEIEALLAPYTNARFAEGRQAGQREGRDAHQADALLDLARASLGGKRPMGARRADTKVFVHIDAEALVAGRTEPGSICRIDGVGPVDVDTVKALFGEAFVVALLEDTVGVRGVVHLGRQVTAHQRSAMEARGYRCEVPGCDATAGLEIDHVHDWALTRSTRLEDLAWLCRHHHGQKTAGEGALSGPLGHRTWTLLRHTVDPAAA
jgi:hypothetical protein